MSLIQARPGVYSFGHPTTTSELPPAVGVHLFYSNLASRGFQIRRTEALQTYSGPVVLLTPEDQVDTTVREVKATHRPGPTYLILTEAHASDPIETTTQDIIQFLEDLSQDTSGPIPLWGGFKYIYRRGWSDESDNGCLLQVKEIFDNGGLETIIHEDVVF